MSIFWNNWNWLEPIISCTHRSTFGGHICLEFAMFEFSIEYFDTQAVYRDKMQCYPLLHTVQLNLCVGLLSLLHVFRLYCIPVHGTCIYNAWPVQLWPNRSTREMQWPKYWPLPFVRVCDDRIHNKKFRLSEIKTVCLACLPNLHMQGIYGYINCSCQHFMNNLSFSCLNVFSLNNWWRGFGVSNGK